MADEQERTMYVGNLHDDATEALLYELFLQAGPLQRISRPKDRESGKVKNFAFVVFVHAASVPYAIHLTNGIKLLGRPLKAQQRNNLDLQHYSTVGVHSIDCENELQRTLDGSQEEENQEDYSNSSRRRSSSSSGSYKRKRQDSSGNSFTPQPLDPNQTWKNNIHYHERQQQQQQGTLVSNVMMAGPAIGMSPSTSRHHQGGGRYHQESQSAAMAASPARSASHYHNINSQILSSSLRSRLGDGGNYRSTQDSGYYGGSPYTAPAAAGGGYGGYNNRYNSNSSGYGSPNASYDNSYSNRGYNNSGNGNYNNSRGYNDGGNSNYNKSRGYSDNDGRGYNNSSRYDDRHNSHNRNNSGGYSYGR